ncbi:MAG: hypothetical protein RJQ01_00815 [Microcella sp.]|uniref:hypothetical protein n=1 Tax=Microcella sp. TaxID=1913979 RepID=UPI0033154FAF
MNSRPWNWLSFLAGLGSALVILGGIWIGTVVVAAQQEAEQERYLSCLAALGFTPETTTGGQLEELSVAAELCS